MFVDGGCHFVMALESLGLMFGCVVFVGSGILSKW